MVNDWLLSLKSKNELLFYFAVFNFCIALFATWLAISKPVYFQGINAYFKVIKFALSIGIYTCTMIVFTDYLIDFNRNLFSVTVTVLFGFEIVYIFWKASRGEASHFNNSDRFHSLMYFFMGSAAAIVTLYTLFIGILYIKNQCVTLPDYYRIAIVLGIVVFVVFSLEGFLMGAKNSHYLQKTLDVSGIPFLNWSYRVGDGRIAHFIGMHALQLIPLAAYFWLKDTTKVFVLATLYFVLSAYVLWIALQGKGIRFFGF